MTSPEQPGDECPVERLTRLTREEPDSPLPEDLCRHLENCQACQARLEANAAPPIDWKLVREALKEPPFSPGETSKGDQLGFSLLRLLTPSDDPSIVGKIGAFEITQVIGSGGMGLVLKARDPALDRFVAVKILAPHLASSATARKRFAREAKAAAAVIHDNVIGIYQVSEHHELPYLVMPYLPDPSLQQRLDTEGKLDVETALSIALQVAKGLEAAHSQGLIHRDVKPANVLLVNATSRAIITDFGLARAADDASLTNSGVLAGTPHYMSPEQARAETVDARSDLFSLGSLLFAMIAGHPPVNRELGSETIRAIASETMPRLSDAAPGAPFWLDRLVAWLHQSDPADRPQTARELAGILDQCLQHLRDPASHPLPDLLTTQEGNSMPTEKDKRLFAVAALGMFVITLLAPVQIALLAPHVEHLPLVFACISFFLTLCFALLSWTEYISRFVVKAAVGLALVAVLVSGAFLGFRFLTSESGGGKPSQQLVDLQLLRNEIAQLRAQQQEKQYPPVMEQGGQPGAGGPMSMMMPSAGPGSMGMGAMGGEAGGPMAPGIRDVAPVPMAIPVNPGTGGLGGPGDQPPIGSPPPNFKVNPGTNQRNVLPSPDLDIPLPSIPSPTGTLLPGASAPPPPNLPPEPKVPTIGLPAPGTSGSPPSILPPGAADPLASPPPKVAPTEGRPFDPPPAGAALSGGGGNLVPPPTIPNTQDTLPPLPDRNPAESPDKASVGKKPTEKESKKPLVDGPRAFFRVNSNTPYARVKKMVDLLISLNLSPDVKSSDGPGNILDILLPETFTKEAAQEIRKKLEPEVSGFPELTVHFVQKGKGLVDPLKSKPVLPEKLEVLEGADSDPLDQPATPTTPSTTGKEKPENDPKGEKPPAKEPTKEDYPTKKNPAPAKPANPPEEKFSIA